MKLEQGKLFFSQHISPILNRRLKMQVSLGESKQGILKKVYQLGSPDWTTVSVLDQI